jgi:hypothetical protein
LRGDSQGDGDFAGQKVAFDSSRWRRHPTHAWGVTYRPGDRCSKHSHGLFFSIMWSKMPSENQGSHQTDLIFWTKVLLT